MKRAIEKTNSDCYIVIDSVRNADSVSLYCIKEATEKYHVFEDYTLYGGEMSFEDGVWNCPFRGLKNSYPMSRRKYARLADEIEAIKEKVIRMPTTGSIVRRESLKAGDCVRFFGRYIKITKTDGDEFEASGLSINKWHARFCDCITGSISQHIPQRMIQIDEDIIGRARTLLNSSIRSLMEKIIKEFGR